MLGQVPPWIVPPLSLCTVVQAAYPGCVLDGWTLRELAVSQSILRRQTSTGA